MITLELIGNMAGPCRRLPNGKLVGIVAADNGKRPDGTKETHWIELYGVPEVYEPFLQKGVQIYCSGIASMKPYIDGEKSAVDITVFPNIIRMIGNVSTKASE